MASFQDIRGILEAETQEALINYGFAADQIFFDNVGETPRDAVDYYAVISLSFGSVVEDVLACEGIERIQGTLQCNIYCPRNIRSKPGEDTGLIVLKAWNNINKRSFDPTPLKTLKLINIEGPITVAPDQRPHQVHVVSCSFYATAA